MTSIRNALLLLFPAILALLGIAIHALVAVIERSAERRRALREQAAGFPVVTPAIPLPNGGPGRYHVIGVAAATGTDAHLEVEAETLANAKVKAELKGIVVTDIQKVSNPLAV